MAKKWEKVDNSSDIPVSEENTPEVVTVQQPEKKAEQSSGNVELDDLREKLDKINVEIDKLEKELKNNPQDKDIKSSLRSKRGNRTKWQNQVLKIEELVIDKKSKSLPIVFSAEDLKEIEEAGNAAAGEGEDLGEASTYLFLDDLKKIDLGIENLKKDIDYRKEKGKNSPKQKQTLFDLLDKKIAVLERETSEETNKNRTSYKRNKKELDKCIAERDELALDLGKHEEKKNGESKLSEQQKSDIGLLKIAIEAKDKNFSQQRIQEIERAIGFVKNLKKSESLKDLVNIEDQAIEDLESAIALSKKTSKPEQKPAGPEVKAGRELKPDFEYAKLDGEKRLEKMEEVADKIALFKDKKIFPWAGYLFFPEANKKPKEEYEKDKKDKELARTIINRITQPISELTGDDKEKMELLAGIYKIHLMPKEEYVPAIVEKILKAIEDDKELKKSFSQLKVHIENEEKRKESDKEKGSVMPILVVYSMPGKENAQVVLDKICELFKGQDNLGMNETPRLNQKVNDLVYYAQGDGGTKSRYRENIGAMFGKQMVENGGIFEPDFIHFKGDYKLKLPGEKNAPTEEQISEMRENARLEEIEQRMEELSTRIMVETVDVDEAFLKLDNMQKIGKTDAVTFENLRNTHDLLLLRRQKLEIELAGLIKERNEILGINSKEGREPKQEEIDEARRLAGEREIRHQRAREGLIPGSADPELISKDPNPEDTKQMKKKKHAVSGKTKTKEKELEKDSVLDGLEVDMRIKKYALENNTRDSENGVKNIDKRLESLKGAVGPAVETERADLLRRRAYCADVEGKKKKWEQELAELEAKHDERIKQLGSGKVEPVVAKPAEAGKPVETKTEPEIKPAGPEPVPVVETKTEPEDALARWKKRQAEKQTEKDRLALEQAEKDKGKEEPARSATGVAGGKEPALAQGKRTSGKEKAGWVFGATVVAIAALFGINKTRNGPTNTAENPAETPPRNSANENPRDNIVETASNVAPANLPLSPKPRKLSRPTFGPEPKPETTLKIDLKTEREKELAEKELTLKERVGVLLEVSSESEEKVIFGLMTSLNKSEDEISANINAIKNLRTKSLPEMLDWVNDGPKSLEQINEEIQIVNNGIETITAEKSKLQKELEEKNKITSTLKPTEDVFGKKDWRTEAPVYQSGSENLPYKNYLSADGFKELINDKKINVEENEYGKTILSILDTEYTGNNKYELNSDMVKEIRAVIERRKKEYDNSYSEWQATPYHGARTKKDFDAGFDFNTHKEFVEIIREGKRVDGRNPVTQEEAKQYQKIQRIKNSYVGKKDKDMAVEKIAPVVSPKYNKDIYQK